MLRAHRGWARLLLDRRCLVQIPNAPRHHTERSYDSDVYNEQTAFDSYMNPEAGFRYGPGERKSESTASSRVAAS